MFRKWWIHVCGWDLDQKSYWSHQYRYASPVVKQSQISLCWVCVRWWCPAGCNAFVNLWMSSMQLGRKPSRAHQSRNFILMETYCKLTLFTGPIITKLSVWDGMRGWKEKQWKKWIRQSQNALQAKMSIRGEINASLYLIIQYWKISQKYSSVYLNLAILHNTWVDYVFYCLLESHGICLSQWMDAGKCVQ